MYYTYVRHPLVNGLRKFNRLPIARLGCLLECYPLGGRLASPSSRQGKAYFLFLSIRYWLRFSREDDFETLVEGGCCIVSFPKSSSALEPEQPTQLALLMLEVLNQ